MSAPPPLIFNWDGDAMVPQRPNLADRYYVVGEQYRLVIEEERSQVTHNHEFAFLADAFKTLPETVADQFPSVEHFRKRLLIDAGFYDETLIDVGTNAGAIRVAAAWRARDDFAHVVVRGGFVCIRTAKSQSRRAMKKAEFQASKQAILELAASMIGVTPETLLRQSAPRVPQDILMAG
jgi:hypothetical protein